MGWFLRTFGFSEQARLERARHFLARGRYNDARLELEGLETPEATALREDALKTLVVWNLEEARARFQSGDPDGAREHMALATQFGASPDQLRETRRFARELREARRREAEDAAREREANRFVPGDDPIWQLPPDHPQLRYALLVESYPDALRARLVNLGKDFAAAVMQLEEGDPVAAWKALGPFVQQDPVAAYERARAALAAGQLPAAASDLMRFGESVGHQTIGNTHTAATLANVMGQLGRAGEALPIIDGLLQTAPSLQLQAVRAQLLEADGQLEHAESATESLLKTAPRQMGLYRLLARIRERRGHRPEAAAVLEWGLDTCCGSPGKCGNQPLDLQAVRTLARLYLEDQVQPERAHELLSQLSRHVQQPSWEDQYLAALVARNTRDPQAADMVARLTAALPAQDPRRRLLQKTFQAAPAQLEGV
ncbi:MAG: hypothetical protein AAFV53_20970 [Myxococcota bacterium]